jgi:mono/diheme cytochrome c family protein
MARRMLTLACAAVLVGSLGACGSKGNSVPTTGVDAKYNRGSVLFTQHCAGCHTLDVVGAKGSATNVRDKERVDGPNFNVRKETVNGILYAIRNGGYSGAFMPENIVVGHQAREIAEFLAHYAGAQAKSPPSPTG